MLFYYINSTFFSPELFWQKYMTFWKIIFWQCSCWASVESWLLWQNASRSSLLYSGFRYTIELPLQLYKIQLYTFRMQGLAFFFLGSPTIGQVNLYEIHVHVQAIGEWSQNRAQNRAEDLWQCECEYGCYIQCWFCCCLTAITKVDQAYLTDLSGGGYLGGIAS